MDAGYFSDRELNLERVCAKLLKSRYIPEVSFRKKQDEIIKTKSSDFTFAVNELEELRTRLRAVGFEIRVSSDGEYIEVFPNDDLNSEFSFGERLSLFESKFLIGIALLYQKNKESVGLYGTIETNMQDLLQVLISENAYLDKIPSKEDLKKVMHRMEECSLVHKHQGTWNELTPFAILPCITNAVSEEVLAAYERKYSDSYDEKVLSKEE